MNKSYMVHNNFRGIFDKIKSHLRINIANYIMELVNIEGGKVGQLI